MWSAINVPDQCTILTSDPKSQIIRPLLNVSEWSYNIIGMFERGPASVRLAYNKRSSYWADWSERADFSAGGTTNPGSGFFWLPYVLRQKVHEPGRLDLSVSYTFMNRFTIFGDWTNILSRPQKVDLIRMDPTGTVFDPTASNVVSFALRSRYQERILSLGVRFNFEGAAQRPAEPPPMTVVPPPPPPAVEAPQLPPPAPPPPPAPVERGERGQ
jgi:outer membrane receptor protein involved in Fe transport